MAIRPGPAARQGFAQALPLRRASRGRPQRAPRIVVSHRGAPRRRSAVSIHRFAQRQRAHIGPDFRDIRRALIFRAFLSGVLPSDRGLPEYGPDRVLLLVVDEDYLGRRVLRAARAVTDELIERFAITEVRDQAGREVHAPTLAARVSSSAMRASLSVDPSGDGAENRTRASFHGVLRQGRRPGSVPCGPPAVAGTGEESAGQRDGLPDNKTYPAKPGSWAGLRIPRGPELSRRSALWDYALSMRTRGPRVCSCRLRSWPCRIGRRGRGSGPCSASRA
jgi:hypothetical protein